MPSCKKCGNQLHETKMLSLSARKHDFGRKGAARLQGEGRADAMRANESDSSSDEGGDGDGRGFLSSEGGVWVVPQDDDGLESADISFSTTFWGSDDDDDVF